PLAFTVNETSRILGITHSVRVVTNADAYQSVAKYYKAADIFVCPTRKEVFGLVLLEAMSSGIPIINGDDGAAIEMTADSGLHFRTGDPHSLADQILNLLDDPALRARLRSQSRERALKLFSWETCAKSYLRLYSAILRK